MRIVVTVENPTGPFQEKLLNLLAEHADQIEVDTTWTVERALQYYRTLPPRAQDIVKGAVAGDGFVSDNELRTEGSSLRGHSGALKRILERGVREGWWPDGMQGPIQPQGPGFGKVKGYRMPDGLVQTFFTAIERYNKALKDLPPKQSVRRSTIREAKNYMDARLTAGRNDEK